MERKTTLELNIGGQMRPLRFDFAFLDALIDLKPLKEIDELSETKPWRVIPIVATAALISGAEYAGLPVTFDQKEVGDWIQQLEDPEDAHQILMAYQTNMGFFMVALAGAAKTAELVSGGAKSAGKK
ncbi:hypothetical protein GCM10027299_29000 [Larkinella ripae]